MRADRETAGRTSFSGSNKCHGAQINRKSLWPAAAWRLLKEAACPLRTEPQRMHSV